MDHKNYTERQEDHTADGYSVRIRENAVHPKSTANPLTVIEFSLTNAVRDSLKEALDAYFKEHGKTIDQNTLGAIMTEHMPKQVMRELDRFGKESTSHIVFVVHNLPEVSDKKALEIVKRDPGRIQIECYAPYIKEGITAALHFESVELGQFPMTRNTRSTVFIGGNMHKHTQRRDMLSGIVSDGAPTRFIDFETLLEEVRENRDVQDIGILIDLPIKHHELLHYERYIPDWMEPQRLEVIPTQEHSDRWEHLVKCHSQEVVLDKGSLAFWSNEGKVFHQALASPRTQAAAIKNSRAKAGEGTICRIIQ